MNLVGAGVFIINLLSHYGATIVRVCLGSPTPFDAH